MPDFDGVHAKLERARLHAKNYNEAAQEIINRRPFELVGQVEDGWFVMRWKQNGSHPDFTPLSLMFGDMLYNLRASLDYLIWQLILVNRATPGQSAAFPCVRKRDNWRSAVNSQLKGVGTQWIPEIKSLQPFNQDPPEQHMLALLDQANNVNKHRLLPVTLLIAKMVPFKVEGLQAGVSMNFDFDRGMNEPIADGVEYGRLTFDREINVTITLDPNLRFRLRFSDITNSDWQNQQMVAWVEETIARFEPAFA